MKPDSLLYFWIHSRRSCISGLPRPRRCLIILCFYSLFLFLYSLALVVSTFCIISSTWLVGFVPGLCYNAIIAIWTTTLPCLYFLPYWLCPFIYFLYKLSYLLSLLFQITVQIIVPSWFYKSSMVFLLVFQLINKVKVKKDQVKCWNLVREDRSCISCTGRAKAISLDLPQAFGTWRRNITLIRKGVV